MTGKAAAEHKLRLAAGSIYLQRGRIPQAAPGVITVFGLLKPFRAGYEDDAPEIVPPDVVKGPAAVPRPC